MYNNIYLCFDQSTVNVQVIIEYVLSFGKKFALKLAELKKLPSYNDDDLYIFIQRIPDSLMKEPTLCKNMILLNIEQITTPKFKDMMKEVLLKNIKVIDYSIENINLIKEFSDNPIGYLPYQYEPSEISKLETFVKNVPKFFDVAFTGWLSPRRKEIISSLQNKGFKVQLVKNEWANSRDFKITSAKLLLNVHYNESYNVYEAIRCDRWTFSGMMIVSEDSFENEALDINKLVIFEKYDKLVDKISEILENYNKYHEEFILKYREMIEDVKKNRSMNQSDFLNMI